VTPAPGPHVRGATIVKIMAVLDPVAHTLLNAASDLLASEGLSALTVRRIASVAGVSTMNVYSRFGSKDGIIDQLYLEGFRRLGADFHAATVHNDPIADLRSLGYAYRKFALANHTLYSVMFEQIVPNFDPSPEAMAEADAAMEFVMERLLRAIEQGVVTSTDPFHTATLMWAVCHGVISLQINSAAPPEVDWNLVYDQAMQLIIKGLA
jgi:AcrR family transcriptional regulator